MFQVVGAESARVLALCSRWAPHLGPFPQGRDGPRPAVDWRLDSASGLLLYKLGVSQLI